MYKTFNSFSGNSVLVYLHQSADLNTDMFTFARTLHLRLYAVLAEGGWWEFVLLIGMSLQVVMAFFMFMLMCFFTLVSVFRFSFHRQILHGSQSARRSRNFEPGDIGTGSNLWILGSCDFSFWILHSSFLDCVALAGLISACGFR